MLQPIKAITWEYFRECRELWAGMVAMVILGPVAFGMLMGLYGAESLHTDDQPMRLYINFLGIAALAWLTPPLYAITTTAKRTRGLPVSTRFLASVTLVLSIALTMVTNLIAQFFYHWYSNLQWPILTTTLSIGAFAALAIAIGWWLRDFKGYKIFVIAGVLSAWVYWLLRHFYDVQLNGPIQMWNTVSAADVLVFGGTVIASWFVTVHSWSRYRCGEADDGWMFLHFFSPQTSLLEITHNSRTINTATDSLPATPAQAFTIMNWENCRSWQAIGNVIIVGFLIFIGLFAFRGRGNPLQGCGAIVMMFSAMAGLLAGQDIWMRQKGGMRPFLSTLPVSDRDYSETMLKSCIKSAFIAWTVVIVANIVLFGIYTVRNGTEHLESHYHQLWIVREFGHWGILWYLVGTALTCWVFAGSMRAMASTGRMMVMVWAMVLTEASVIAVVFLAGLGDDGAVWAQQASERVALTMAFIFGVSTTVFLFARARRRNLVTISRTFWSAATVIALSTILVTFLPTPTVWKVIWCCTAGLVVTPIAAIPCAVQWSRHR